MAPPEGEVVNVRPYQAADEAAVRALLDTTFDRRVDTTWRERPADGPDVSPLVLEREGEIRAFVRLDPVPTWIERERHWLALAGDFVVAPELRGSGAFVQLSDEVRRVCFRGGLSGLVGFPRQSFAKRVKERRGGVVELGRIPQWVHWADARGVERSGGRRLAGPQRAAVGALAKATGLAVRLSGGLDEGIPSASELDDLAARSAGWATVVRERGHRHFQERWLERSHRWHIRTHRRRGRLAGVVVFGIRLKRGGVPIGRIVDVLAGDPRSFRALIAGATRELRAIGCDTVLLELNDRRRWVGPTLRSCGFLPRGIGPVMIVIGAVNPALNEMGNWYLTLGDSDLG